MKKHFFLSKLAILPLLALTIGAGAQTNRVSSNEQTFSNREVADQNETVFNSQSAAASRALKNFSKYFKEAGNASWFDIRNAMMAKFTNDNIETNVYYDSKGRWLAKVRNYYEDNLPKDIRRRVKSTYYDANIFYVQEITVGRQMAYLVKIEDDTTIKTIRILDDEMDEYQVIEKTNS